MLEKAQAGDFRGRFREIVSDPLNLLIARHPQAGMADGDEVVLHNGHRVSLRGDLSYYDDFSDILIINRGVHEPLEEYAFQQVLAQLPESPTMLELGAYWAHYSMWFQQARPKGQNHLVEPEEKCLAVGKTNFDKNGYTGRFTQAFVGQGQFEVDSYLVEQGLDHLTILHSDIQGYEVEMLDGAQKTLSEQRADYLFISTHTQEIHAEVLERLNGFGYRVEVSADFEYQTTSYDGFILGVAPNLPRVFSGAVPLGRGEIAVSAPNALLNSLQNLRAKSRFLGRFKAK